MKSPTPSCSTSGFPIFPDSTSCKELRQTDPKLPVIVMTTHGTAETAIEAMQRGAFDYLLKPWDLEELTDLVNKALEAGRLSPRPRGHRSGIRFRRRRRPRHRPISRDAERLQRDRPDRGPGRDRADPGRERHRQGAGRTRHLPSQPPQRPAVSGDQLRGHPRNAAGKRVVRPRERGVYRRRPRAHRQIRAERTGGTLFLDEIGDAAPATQAKILRVLQDGKFERVGGNETIHVDVRIIAATSRDLEQAMQRKEFRPDLFFRLNTFTLRLPPLRERPDDIPLLAEHFFKRFRRELAVDVRRYFPRHAAGARGGTSGRATSRELESAVKFALVHTTGEDRDAASAAGQCARPIA